MRTNRIGPITGSLGAAALLALTITLSGCGGGSGSASGPRCTLVGPGAVAMVVTADHQNPAGQCRSAEKGLGDLAQEGPWRAGSAPSGQAACSAFIAGITETFYDPNNTGGASNDCTILQEDGWQVTWSTQSS